MTCATPCFKVLLASSSAPRRQLMDQLGIAWEPVEQEACELSCNVGQPLDELVLDIARSKADAAKLGAKCARCELFLISADTLCADAEGKVYGKPAHLDEQVAFLKARRGKEQYIYTGLCVRRLRWVQGVWQILAEETRVVRAAATFDMSDSWIEWYVSQGKGLHASGGFAITDGMQFVKEIHGSYTAIIGLPLYELREALEKLGYY